MTDSSDAGTITLAGRPVPRFGFGTMRLTGPKIFGEPADRVRRDDRLQTFDTGTTIPSPSIGAGLLLVATRDGAVAYR